MPPFSPKISARVIFCLACIWLVFSAPALHAQGPKGKSFGFGLSLGDPTAVSFRIWTSRENSWEAAIGRSHFGSPHIQGGYLWHMNDVFNSRVVCLYVGAGAAIGFGGPEGDWWFHHGHGHDDEWYWDGDHEMALAARGIFGLNVIPKNTPIDIFLELDPIIGLVPGFGFDIMPAVGIRFYP
jgi:hypothetical protein